MTFSLKIFPLLCSGLGEVIGMLKVGQKHLFLFDEREQVHELEPLCVLDFYVVPSRQRSGLGRSLFDYMLHVSTYNLPKVTGLKSGAWMIMPIHTVPRC